MPGCRLNLLAVLVFLACKGETSFVEKINLGDFAWTVSSRNSGRNITVQAKVPGGIFSDLENAGIIGNIYYRFNDIEYRWIGETDWAYSAEIYMNKEHMEHSSIQLEFQGLDTVATVMLNGEVIGASDNMFVQYIFDVKDHIKSGVNQLEIQFQSPVTYAKEQFEYQSKDHVVPPSCVPDVFQGVCHANHIRKMQSSFSWDWGPAAASVGIWKEVHLIMFDQVRVSHLTWDVIDDGNNFAVEIQAGFQAVTDTPVIINVELVGLSSDQFEEVILAGNLNGETPWTGTVNIPKTMVRLWWPNGHGDQPLYDVNVTVIQKTGGREELLDQVYRPSSLGFRTVELVQDPIGDDGTSFYFKINDKPIFMKGSNWIPAHVLPEKVTRDYVYDLLYSAKEAHMNMLRVWGGGIYETDDFYQIADELGILIWQDFMFACSMYPANQAFLDNVRQEVQHQVNRLKSHPSIALWAGNNENEVALRGNWYGTDTNFSVYKGDYIRLYVETVKSVVEDLEITRPFLLSSPSNGLHSESEGYIAANPYSILKGDIHVYNYRDNTWDPNVFVTPRFCSEYGFQAFPSFEVMKTVSQESDWSFSSDWFKKRQHHPEGNLELPWQINLNLFINLDLLDTREGMEEFLYLSQVYQAVSLKTESEHYRRGRNKLNDKNEGLTMGALYWQLNDIWPGASWTSLEYGGKWKISHHFAEDFFAPILVSPVIENNLINAYVICDKVIDDHLSLTIRIRKWEFEESYSKTIQVGPVCRDEGAFNIYTEQRYNELLEAGDCKTGTLDMYRMNYCLMSFHLTTGITGDLLSENYLMNAPRGLVGIGEDFPAGLQQAQVQARVLGPSNQVPEGPYVESYDVEVLTDQIALYVLLEMIGVKGRFSTNGFHMAQPTKTIRFYSKEYIGKAILEEALQVRAYRAF